MLKLKIFNLLKKNSDSSRLLINIFSIILVILGMLQMIGFILGNHKVLLIGQSLALSPLPRPFPDINKYEYFASDINYEVMLTNGTKYFIQQDRNRLSKLEGPHKRRIVYIAAIAQSPRLPKYIYNSVLVYGFCNNGPLSKLLGINDEIDKVFINIKTLTEGRNDKWRIPIVCKNGKI